MPNFAHRNFSSGEVSPALTTNSQNQIYQNALSLCKNWIILRDGSFANRAGSEFKISLESHERPLRIFPIVDGIGIFFKNTTDNYVFLKTYDNNLGLASVVRSFRNRVNLTSFTTDLLYKESDVFDISIVQREGIIYFFHKDYYVKRMVRSGNGVWSLNESYFGFGAFLPRRYPAVSGVSFLSSSNYLYIASNAHSTGDAVPANHSYHLQDAKMMMMSSAPSLTVTNAIKTAFPKQLSQVSANANLNAYVAIFQGNLFSGVLSNPVYGLSKSTSVIPENTTYPWNYIIPLNLQKQDSNNRLYETIVFVKKNYGGSNAVWSLVILAEGTDSYYSDVEVPVDTDGGITLSDRVIFNIVQTQSLANAKRQYWSLNSLTGNISATTKTDFLTATLGTAKGLDESLSINKTGFYVSTNATTTISPQTGEIDGNIFDGFNNTATSLEPIADATSQSIYAITAVYRGNKESRPIFINLASGTFNKKSASDTDKNFKIGFVSFDLDKISFFKIYRRFTLQREERKGWGYVGAIDALEATTNGYMVFTDDRSIDADFSEDITPWESDLDAKVNYPNSGTMFKQRFVVGGGINTQSDQITASEIGILDNFNWEKENIGDSDAFRISLPGRNEIISLADIGDFVILTKDGEFSMDRTADFTPTKVAITRQSSYGSKKIEPVIIDNLLFFVQKGGKIIRGFNYDFQKNGYKGVDVTVFAAHLFRDNEIVSWAFTRRPENILWVVRDDGVLLSMTFVEEQSIIAWSQHEIGGGGKVESISEEDDTLYLLVNRNNVRTIEAIPPREKTSYFIDGLILRKVTKASSGNVTLSGLSLFAGKKVSVIANNTSVLSSPLDVNYSLSDLTVNASGVLTFAHSLLPGADSEEVTIGVGFPIDARAKTVPLDMPTPDSNFVERLIANTVTLQLQDTRGIFVSGHDFKTMSELKARTDNLGKIIDFNGFESLIIPAAWQTGGGQISIAQWHPVPAHINMIIAEGDIK